MKCGSFFNKHKWEYLNENLRRCKKCGVYQRYIIGPMPGISGEWI